MHDTSYLIPIIVAAAQRTPTQAALRSVRAALTGAAPAPDDPPDDEDLVRDHSEPVLPLADPPPDAPRSDPHQPVDRPDPHDLGQPDPSLDWMFAPRGHR